MDVFASIAERRILQAMEDGAFENLAGHGRPLDFSEDRGVPRELRTVYRILKNADCLPPEILLRKEVRSLEELLPRVRDEGHLRELVREINEKVTALNLMSARNRGHSVRNDVAQLYVEKLVDRLRRP